MDIIDATECKIKDNIYHLKLEIQMNRFPFPSKSLNEIRLSPQPVNNPPFKCESLEWDENYLPLSGILCTASLQQDRHPLIQSFRVHWLEEIAMKNSERALQIGRWEQYVDHRQKKRQEQTMRQHYIFSPAQFTSKLDLREVLEHTCAILTNAS